MVPTAQALWPEVAATPSSTVPPGWRRSSFHAWPSECSITAWCTLERTAQPLLAEVAATAYRVAPPGGTPLGVGLATRFHTWPFQCKISVWAGPTLPTAQASRAEVAATPPRKAPP